MTATQPDSPRLTRRGLMRTTVVGLGAAAGVGALGSTARPAAAIDWGSVGKTAALVAVSPPVALGWALREFEVLGSDAPAEGLTADALKNQIYQAARKRKSTNASTIVDNQNILDGVENNAYTEAKISAIEELNAGSAESAVLTAAEDSIDAYETTIRKNLLKSWNETVAEIESFDSAIWNQSEVSWTDIGYGGNADGYIWDSGGTAVGFGSWNFPTTGYTLPDGTAFTVRQLNLVGEFGTDLDATWSLLGSSNTTESNWIVPYEAVQVKYDGDTVVYFENSAWKAIFDEMDTTFQNVRDGINTWVSSVYSDFQSGEIEISELITPRERAAMLSSDESEAQAIADLAALNIPIDPEREATVTITETGATLSGTIGLTDESDGPIESGTTYDPSTFAGDVYLTADVSQLSGTWDAYQTGVDGGTVTLTAQPYEGTVLNVTTAAGETVSVPAGDWTDNGDGTYSYDASGDLETTITEVESVAYESAATETQYETLNLSKQFTVESIVNRETGENTSSASFESNEPQTDSNYITQDEWDQLEQQNQALIEKFEESQSSGGAGGGFFSGSGSPDIGLIAAGLGGLGVVYALFGQGDS